MSRDLPCVPGQHTCEGVLGPGRPTLHRQEGKAICSARGLEGPASSVQGEGPPAALRCAAQCPAHTALEGRLSVLPDKA